MLMEGVKITILGMATVFVMLGALVLATAINARIIGKIEKTPAPAAGGIPPPADTDAARDDRSIAAVISAAISMFRRMR